MVAAVNALAPEHLELLGPTIEPLAEVIQHYGGLFVGAGTKLGSGKYTSIASSEMQPQTTSTSCTRLASPCETPIRIRGALRGALGSPARGWPRRRGARVRAAR